MYTVVPNQTIIKEFKLQDFTVLSRNRFYRYEIQSSSVIFYRLNHQQTTFFGIPFVGNIEFHR
jgi:hypothetical protein